MRITAGPGDSATWAPYTGHPNDPRTNTEAIIKARKTAEENIRKSISYTAENWADARMELSDHIIRYLCDVEVVGLVDAYLAGDRERLFKCFETILNDAIATKAEIDVEY